MEEITMKTFWQAGGFGMYQVALFGLALVWAAVRFALRPDERQVAYVRALGTATGWSIAFAVASDFATVFHAIAALSGERERWAQYLLQGSYESFTPAVLGFGLISLAWVAQAFGIWRLGRALP
jgi:hypothetical protein